jgi:glycosyltransferase involved in cell wall biosynthesis
MLTFNRENYIKRSIESIIKQTYTNFEFIIVDNGSTDKSGIIADHYSILDKRIRVKHIKRGNIGSGRNVGLDSARGEYITFVDDDDYAEPDFLSFLLNLAKTYDADISVCGSYQEQDGIISPNWTLVYDECYIMSAEQATEMFLKRKLYNAAMPTKLIKRKMTEMIRFESEGSYDDITITYKYLANANRVVAQGKPMYTFLRHVGNNSSAATKHSLLNPKQLNEYFKAYRARTNYISKIYPNLAPLARYRELAYMVSMIEKIHRYGLENCSESLAYMKSEVKNKADEFLESGFCEDYEKKWFDIYIK